MKVCDYCGCECEDVHTACRQCGTSFYLTEPSVPGFSRLGRIILWIAVLLAVSGLVLAMPWLLFGVPVLAVFFLPIYLPFVFSFAIRQNEWRGMRWTLRFGSVLALFIGACGMSSRPDFGSDVAGSVAGAGHNFAWIWGSGLVCATCALLLGLVFRVVHSRRA